VLAAGQGQLPAPNRFLSLGFVAHRTGCRSGPVASIAAVETVSPGISEGVGVGAAAERELVARLMAGDAGALTKVYKQYGGIVFGVCRRVLRDTTLAEDVTQEVFV